MEASAEWLLAVVNFRGLFQVDHLQPVGIANTSWNKKLQHKFILRASSFLERLLDQNRGLFRFIPNRARNIFGPEKLSNRFLPGAGFQAIDPKVLTIGSVSLVVMGLFATGGVRIPGQ